LRLGKAALLVKKETGARFTGQINDVEQKIEGFRGMDTL
jgi:hypothetical protein